MKFLLFLLLILFFSGNAQTDQSIEIGTFNIRFFPCNQDGEFMKGYRKGNSFRQASHQVQLEVRKKLHVKEPIHKISFITWDPAEAQDILKEMQPLKGVHVFRSLAYLYDIISDESSKGSSARYLKETMGAKKLYGIGDNETGPVENACYPTVLDEDVQGMKIAVAYREAF